MFTVQTSRGPVPIWGRLGDGPLLFVIRGLTPAKDFLLPLADRFPSVVLVHLPGMHTPYLAENSVQAFADAYDEVIQRLGRRTAVVGVSLGGVVALALRRAERLLLIDPPLRTLLPEIEPLIAPTAERLPQVARWFSDMIGYTSEGWSPKDYSSLLRSLEVPAHTLAASRGYCRAEDVQHPLMRVTTVESGHIISRDAPNALLDAIKETLADMRQLEL